MLSGVSVQQPEFKVALEVNGEAEFRVPSAATLLGKRASPEKTSNNTVLDNYFSKTPQSSTSVITSMQAIKDANEVI